MLSAIAYRALAQAQADHADIKVLAAGDSVAQQKAIQMLQDAAPTTGVGYAPTPPKGPYETIEKSPYLPAPIHLHLPPTPHKQK